MDLENLQNGIKYSIKSERRDKFGQLWQNLPGLTGILCLHHRSFGLAKINNIVSPSWYHINRFKLKQCIFGKSFHLQLNYYQALRFLPGTDPHSFLQSLVWTSSVKEPRLSQFIFMAYLNLSVGR